MKLAPLAPLMPLIALPASPAWAHPGDHASVLSNFISHLLSEPDHLVLVLLCVAAAIGVGWVQRRNRLERLAARRPGGHSPRE